MVAGTGWLRVGPLSQLVMRSFDVADRGGWVVEAAAVVEEEGGGVVGEGKEER